MIVIAADHGGFNLKCELINHLESHDIKINDVGNHEFDETDDYPDIVNSAIKEILKDPKNNKGILCCRSGTGEVIMANRFPGIRATISWSQTHAMKSRDHNNTNVLILPADYVSVEEAIKIMDTWLETPFSEKDRHIRRLEKIEKFAKQKEEVSRLHD